MTTATFDRLHGQPMEAPLHAAFRALRERWTLWRRYRRTLAELRTLSLDGRLDLDIYAGDIPALARRAVYGR